MGRASEAILALNPVTFRYTEEGDPDRAPQFGLVAEDVEKVDRELVIHDEEGKPFTVRYEAINAMLLNEFLKEHRKVQQLEKQIEALSGTVQKVSERLQLNNPGAQLVANER
jgi:trimeric autotransporter adhesin